MTDLEIGQVISAKIRFNNSGLVSAVNHPYLITGINQELGIIEIAQLDNTFQAELYEGLGRYRRQPDKLSERKLESIIKAYRDYHSNYHIDENKQVYMTKQEFEDLQK